MSKRGKYATLNLEAKMKVLSRIEDGQSVKSVMDEFGIAKSTFYDIKKNRQSILDFVAKQDRPLVVAGQRKRTTGAKFGDVEEAVLAWYRRQRAAGVPVRGVELQAAAERCARRFGRTDFKASTGWLFRFRNRHAIGGRRAAAEGARVDPEAVERFLKKLALIIKHEQLLLAQVYNGDETGLFWKPLPGDTRAGRGDARPPTGTRNQLSAFLCANASGTHKLKSVVIGPSKKPVALAEVPAAAAALPVIYKRGAPWFTRESFSEWFFQNFIPEVRAFQLNILKLEEDDVKAVLLLDKTPAHPTAKELASPDGRIKCLCLPAHASPLIQPMAQGVILSCKQLYRHKQLEERLVVWEQGDEERDSRGEKATAKAQAYNMKSAIFNWAKSWDEVEPATIANAWKNLLYRSEPELDLQGLEDGDYQEVLERCGEVEASLHDVREWLKGDEEDAGYPDDPQRDPAGDGGVQDGEGAEGDEGGQRAAKFKLSKVRENLDCLLDFVDTTLEFQRFYFTLKEMQQEVIKKQFQRGSPA
ncbi:tigger transposable element-derived protein 7 [Tachyglossus aculeatus]|uniref:tigger transposable element-derived protein 7 n=1 Tax=Tachyglossus aculeatus TaxID=9261 RepID=UPI0018F48B57|nr:tigger transposable element-derived protein 7 [Tachyglossus aculeatus]